MFHLILTAFFLVVLPSSCLAIITKRKIELYIGVMLPIYAVWLYLLGMLNCLIFGRITIIISIWTFFALMIMYSVYTIRNKSGKAFLCNILSNVLTPGFFVFLIGIVFSAYLSFGRIYSANDEFSHWGRVVKILYLYNDLPIKNEQALNLIDAKTYPLGTSLVGYLFAVQYNSQIFFDYAHYFASKILIFSFFTLLTYNTKRKNTILAFIFVASIFFSCLSFYGDFFTNVYVDAVLGISLASCLYVSFVFSNPTLKQSIYLAIQLSFLILIKESGAGLAILVLIAPVSISAVQALRSLIKKSFRFKYLYGFIPLSAFLVNIIHKYSVRGINYKFSGEKITVNNIYECFCFNSNGIFQDVWDKMITQLFFAKNATFLIQTSFFAVTLVLSLVVLLLGRISDRKNIVIRFIPYLLLFGFLIYSIVLLLFYNFSFSSNEALQLASFKRYMATYMIFAVLVCYSISYFILNCCIDTKKEKAISLYVMLLIPFLNLSDYTVIRSYFAPITNNKMHFASIFNQIVSQNISEDDSFFVICQEDRVYYRLVPSVYFPKNYKPQRTSWGEPQYEGDRWSRNYSDKQIKNMLKRYQYCYLLKSNNYFVDHYAKFFSAIPDKSHVLYRCTDGKFIPVPLREFIFDFQYCSLLTASKETKAFVNYSARNRYLSLGLLKDGEIELKPISDCPLWNGNLSKINISFGKIQGETKLSIKLNDTTLYEELINESINHIDLDIPSVIVSNLSINLVGQKERNNVIINKICLLYNQIGSGTEHLCDVSPFSHISNSEEYSPDTHQKEQLPMAVPANLTLKEALLELEQSEQPDKQDSSIQK